MPPSAVGWRMEWLPPSWCPKVVVIDIDGTITDGKKHLSMEAVESIRRLEDAGVPAVSYTHLTLPTMEVV